LVDPLAEDSGEEEKRIKAASKAASAVNKKGQEKVAGGKSQALLLTGDRQNISFFARLVVTHTNTQTVMFVLLW